MTRVTLREGHMTSKGCPNSLFSLPPPQDEAQRAAVEDVQADKAQGQMDTRTIALCNVPTENEAC